MSFYVYLHRKKTTGEVFYVGKGKRARAYSSESRSDFWGKVVNKHGFTVEIYASGLQEWYAHELEINLIAYYGRRNIGLGPLVNLTDGGEGNSGAILTENQIRAASEGFTGLRNPKADRTIYDFINIHTRETFKGTRYDLEQTIGKSVSDLFSAQTFSVNDWTLLENLHNTSRDINIHTFVHESGDVFVGTRVLFKRKYGFSCKALFNHNRRSPLEGWSILKDNLT